MASKLNLGSVSHGDKSIHFLRIILSDNLIQGKLKLPPIFVSKYGKYLSDTMFLKLPNGAEWSVNLEKHDDGVWFQKGWNEFVKYHSLAHGHLLIFRYDGSSHFHVLICDMGGTEIEYPINESNHRVRIKSEEIQPFKRQKTSAYNKNNKSNLQDTVFPQQVRDNKGKRKIEGSSISNYGVRETAETTSFTVIMKSGQLIRNSLYLPKGTLKSYRKPGEQYVTLLVGDSSWKVKLSNYRNRSCSYFTAKWPLFAKDNDLKEGDACLFQILNYSDDELVMRVSISRFSNVKKAIT